MASLLSIPRWAESGEGGNQKTQEIGTTPEGQKVDFVEAKVHDEPEKLESKESGQSAGLGTMSGVYLPTIQNIFGVIVFIRLPWIGNGSW